MISVSKVEEISPLITTMAKGLCISEPGPVAKSRGCKPKAAIVAVISTGLRRFIDPSITASLSAVPFSIR